MLAHSLRREVWRLVLLVCGALWALLSLPSLVGGMVWLSRQPAAVTHDFLVVGGTLLVVGWLVVPLLVPGLDDSLEVTRFRTFAVPVPRLLPGLLVASLLGLPTAFTGLVCLAPALAWSGSGGAAALAAVAVAPVALATCVVGARVATGIAARVLGSRRSRETGAVLGLVVVGLLVPAALGLGSLGLEGALERVPAVARVLGWTPLGLTWAVPAAVAEGDVVGGVARALLALAWLAVAVGAWAVLLRRALVSPASRGGEVRRRRDALLPARERGADDARAAERRATHAVLRRALRYWAGDPRYLSALLGAVVAPVAIVLLLATVVDAPAAVALAMGPLMAGTIGWGRHNDLAFDGSALWMHVVAAVPGRADRAGRLLATAVWAVPATVAVGVATAWVGGRPDLAPASVGASLGVLGVGLAVSAVFSPLLPYPVPAAGENPYSAQVGALGASMVAQLATSGATLVACSPVLVLYALALWWEPGLSVAVLLTGAAVGVGAALLGVRTGGRVYDARVRHVLARLG
ncbi:hypothetical protein [Actinotalea solisilvae]|uniref:hypothetical protein n=1 Tax=Actinotalea solisilvae TaxID=2072922 RepID=UPI0018F207D6|nr:hypothetical protein [Actinotalea solisilvae]